MNTPATRPASRVPLTARIRTHLAQLVPVTDPALLDALTDDITELQLELSYLQRERDIEHTDQALIGQLRDEIRREIVGTTSKPTPIAHDAADFHRLRVAILQTLPAEELCDLVDNEVEALIRHVQDLAASPRTIFRAEYADAGLPLGLYGTAEEARKHCEAMARHEHPTLDLHMHWTSDDVPDDLDDGLYWAELTVAVGGHGIHRFTGYSVTELEVAAAYDPEADS